MSAPFRVSDKVVRVDSICKRPPPKDHPERHKVPKHGPQFGTVYVVSCCWETSIGWQVWLVGFGGNEPPTMNGLPTGWDAENFRKIEHIREENRLRQRQTQPAATEGAAT